MCSPKQHRVTGKNSTATRIVCLKKFGKLAVQSVWKQMHPEEVWLSCSKLGLCLVSTDALKWWGSPSWAFRVDEHNLPRQMQPGQAKATRDRMGAAVPRRLVVVAALRSETPALWDMGWREGTCKNMLVFQQELQLPRSIHRTYICSLEGC